MGKRGMNQMKGRQYSKKIKLHKEDLELKNGDDEIDAFHKKRDMIPLDINADNIDSDDDDDEQPVFNYEGINGSDEDEDEDEEDDDDDDDDDNNVKGLAAKIVRQQKYLREKIGGVDDEVDEDTEEDEKKKKPWSDRKHDYYDAENKDYELQSSDEDTLVEEEEEVIKLQKERAESMRAEDFGLLIDEEDDSNKEPTLEEMMSNGRPKSKSLNDKQVEADATPMYEEVKKDLSALSRDEQMDVVYSSAPELVGLLAELHDATKQLETLNPLLSKVKKGENPKREGLHYLEVKQLLLLAYCQAITFYLLLKSEGQPIRDHPVISRLVEIKSLLDKIKELDGLIPDGLESVLVEKSDITTAKKPATKEPVLSSDLSAKLNKLIGSSAEKEEPIKLKKAAEPVHLQCAGNNEKRRRMDKRQDQAVSSESVKMLQYRAELEKKLKHKAGLAAPKTDNSTKHKLKKLAGKFETTDDFDDDAMDLEGTTHDFRRTSTISSKLSQIIPAKGKKGVSGDEDLPARDDLGERRWKHELRVLAGAGIKSKDDDDTQFENEPENVGGEEADAGNSDEENGSEDDYYNLVKTQREAKLKMKADMYSRNPEIEFEAETTADGKRHISTQMEKNRGLTRPRKKENKNPRAKLKMKHAKAVNRRKGQVRDVRKPTASYGGEATGINPGISRSLRL